MGHRRMRVEGAGPYREAELTLSRPPRRPGWLVVLAGLAVVLGAIGWRGARAWRRHAWEAGAGARAAAVAHAGRLTSGEQVIVLRGEGDDAEVVRVPGRLVRRGTDVVREVEVLPARGAVALSPYGTSAIGRRGEAFEVPGADPARDATPYEPRGSSTQVPAGWANRPEDGLSVVSLAVKRLRVPEPAEVVMAPGEEGRTCVRGRRGQFACGTVYPIHFATGAYRDINRPAAVTPFALTPEVRASRVALNATDLCAVGLDGALFCAFGPEGERRAETFPPPAIALVRSLGGVADVALSDEVGCVEERSGGVLCWGQVLRDRGIVRRDAAVEVGGFDAAERVVAVGGHVCALQRGEVSCWGGAVQRSLDRPREDHPRPVVLIRTVRSLASMESFLIASLEDGTIRRLHDDPHSGWLEEVLPAVPVRLHSLVVAGAEFCALDDDARAWCSFGHPRETFGRAPAFDGFERFVEPGCFSRCVWRGGDLRCGPTVGWDDFPGEYAVVRERVRRALRRTDPAPGALVQSLTPREIEAGETDLLGQDGDYDPELRSVLGGGVRAIVRPPARESPYTCLLGSSGRVACRWRIDPALSPDGEERAHLVAGLDDAVELTMTRDGLACARRASGRVACWGRNVGGALTANSTDAPRTYRLDALVARAAHRR